MSSLALQVFFGHICYRVKMNPGPESCQLASNWRPGQTLAGTDQGLEGLTRDQQGLAGNDQGLVATGQGLSGQSLTGRN